MKSTPRNAEATLLGLVDSFIKRRRKFNVCSLVEGEGMSGAVREISIASDQGTPYFLRVGWSSYLGAGFTLALSDGSSAWIGEVSEEDVTREARDMEVERESYVEYLHRALIGGGGGGAEGEVSSFHLSSDHSRLSYQNTTQRGISMNVGSVELHPAPDPVELNRELIGHTLQRSTHLETENHQLLEENQRLRQKHLGLLAELEQHVQDKEVMEGDLFSRFVKVLNKKKAKIRGLKDTIGTLQQKKHEQEEEEMGRGKGVTVKSQVGTNIEGEEKDEVDRQSISMSQAPTVLIIRDHQSQESSMEGSVCDSTDAMPSRKHCLPYPPIPDSQVKKPSLEPE